MTKARGTLELIIGNMFAGKTSELIRKIEVMRKFGQKKVIIFKPEIDSRSGSGKIKNYHGNFLEAVDIPDDDSRFIIPLLQRMEDEKSMHFDVIAVDEVQFFKESSNIYLVIDQLLEAGYDVIAAGLRVDFKGEPFGPTLSLIGLCTGIHNVTLLNSYCSCCGEPAALPQRMIEGEPAPYKSDQVQVGGNESYEARCYKCHKLPGKPKF